MLVFYDVDTQNDFMEKNGTLYIPGSEEIKPVLKELTRYALRNNILILGSSDRHFQDDEELKTFPPHCMDGTWGMERIKETKTSELKIENKYAPGKFRSYTVDELKNKLKKNKAPRITIEKQSIDVFSNPYASKIFELLDVDGAIVYGVATEYCVKSAVMGMLELGIDVYLVRDGIRGMDKKASENSLREMYLSGAKILNSDDILKNNFLERIL